MAFRALASLCSYSAGKALSGRLQLERAIGLGCCDFSTDSIVSSTTSILLFRPPMLLTLLVSLMTSVFFFIELARLLRLDSGFMTPEICVCAKLLWLRHGDVYSDI